MFTKMMRSLEGKDKLILQTLMFKSTIIASHEIMAYIKTCLENINASMLLGEDDDARLAIVDLLNSMADMPSNMKSGEPELLSFMTAEFTALSTMEGKALAKEQLQKRVLAYQAKVEEADANSNIN